MKKLEGNKMERLIHTIIHDIAMIILNYVVFLIFTLIAKFWMKINISNELLFKIPFYISIVEYIVVKIINLIKNHTLFALR